MKKEYLLTIEIRGRGDYEHDKKITLGIFKTFEDACNEGNKALEELEKTFQLHKFPDGTSKRDRLGVRGFFVRNLVTNLAYLNTPFDFYLNIETLIYEDMKTIINFNKEEKC